MFQTTNQMGFIGFGYGECHIRRTTTSPRLVASTISFHSLPRVEASLRVFWDGVCLQHLFPWHWKTWFDYRIYHLQVLDSIVSRKCFFYHVFNKKKLELGYPQLRDLSTAVLNFAWQDDPPSTAQRIKPARVLGRFCWKDLPKRL